jgi:phosphinothricin acetyltransferase
MTLTLRDATIDDAAACAAIYAPYVTDTAITFELDPPGAETMSRRIAAALATHAWVVAEDDGRVVGYAYGGPFKARAAYRWATEVSVYAETGRRRTGAGRLLYTGLFERLEARGFGIAVAVMSLPNEASVGLHEALGFECVGVHRRIGYKLGRWHDVALWQRPLAPLGDPPAEPS